MSPAFVGSLVALAGAIVWGTGDFVGGLATRGRSPFQVLLVASSAGLAMMFAALLLSGEPMPSGQTLVWSSAAGILGALGIAALYRGLATDQAARVAPTASVIGATFPVLLGSVSHGLPTVLQALGMATGVAGIWFVSGGERLATGRGLRLAVAAGLGFGAFFVLIAQAEAGRVFGPLVVSKGAAVLLSAALLIRSPAMRSGGGTVLALFAGGLDAGGNVLYLWAAQLTRFEIAAVLASMAPAVTVLLAGLISRQRVSLRQGVGVLICLTAIGFLVA